MTLTKAQMPAQRHILCAAPWPLEDDKPWDNVLGGSTIYTGPTGDPTHLVPVKSDQIGEGAAHDNVQPSLCINFLIAIDGIYPSRN